MNEEKEEKKRKGGGRGGDDAGGGYIIESNIEYIFLKEKHKNPFTGKLDPLRCECKSNQRV